MYWLRQWLIAAAVIVGLSGLVQLLAAFGEVNETQIIRK